MKTIIWAKAASVDMPCDQRVELIAISPRSNCLDVRLCGTNEARTISIEDIIKIEFEDSDGRSFRMVNVR